MPVAIRFERTVGHAFDKELALAFKEELGNGTGATEDGGLTASLS